MSESMPNVLLIALLVYTAASFIHFSHNAEYLADYPNMPSWISRLDVYVAWIGVTFTGVSGYVLFSYGYRTAALLMFIMYAGLGFDDLAHYSLASISAHTLIMNTTIWFEVISAVWLLVVTCRWFMNQLRVAVVERANEP